jgi:predicted TIM-barrel fold metal-dependent hydrolase
MIDTHLHLWNPATIPRAWLAGVPALDRAMTLEDYRAIASKTGIEAAVQVESDVDDGNLERELEEAVAVLGTRSLVRASVVGGRPGHPGFEAWLDRVIRSSGVVGVRRVFHGLGGEPDAFVTTPLIDDLRRLGARDLLFELCIRPDQLQAAIRLVDACPETEFVLDHLGRPEIAAGVTTDWSEGMRRIADRPNVVAKLSGLIECSAGREWTVETFRPFVELAVDRFGADRLVWGGNWPVCELGGSLERWVSATRSLLADRSAVFREAVYEVNARRIYRLR